MGSDARDFRRALRAQMKFVRNIVVAAALRHPPPGLAPKIIGPLICCPAGEDKVAIMQIHQLAEP